MSRLVKASDVRPGDIVSFNIEISSQWEVLFLLPPLYDNSSAKNMRRVDTGELSWQPFDCLSYVWLHRRELDIEVYVPQKRKIKL